MRTLPRNFKLILILSFLITLVLFGALSASLDSNWLKEIDERLLLLMSGSPAGRTNGGVLGLVTQLGSDYVLGAVVLLVCVLLYRSGQTPEMIGMLAVGAGAKVLEHGLKFLFHRTRPELLLPTKEFFGDYAFPSGHSLNAAAVYGFILIVIGANFRPTFWKNLIVAAGGLLILTIGISRVILRMHWPSDVAAGWLVAGMLLSLVLFVLSMFKGRRDVRI